MSIFFNAAAQVGDKFGVNAVNSILSLFASNTAPTSPFVGQVWLDTSVSPKALKEWNGSSWNILFSLRPFGTTAGSVCQGNDSRLSNARTPVSHNNTYHSKTFITRSDLWRDSTSNNTANVFWQSGRTQLYSTVSTTVTFDVAFSSIPRVMGSAEYLLDSPGFASITTTSFVGACGRIGGVGVSQSYVNWCAVGQKT